MKDLNVSPETEAVTPAQARRNRFYQALVEDDEDLVGLVAYALYKQSKRQWMIAYYNRTKSQPSEDALAIYYDSLGDGQLKALRSDAEQALLRFSEKIIESRLPELEETALRKEIRENCLNLGMKIDEKTSLRQNALGNIASALILTGISAIIILGIYLVPDIRSLVESVVNYVRNRPG